MSMKGLMSLASLFTEDFSNVGIGVATYFVSSPFLFQVVVQNPVEHRVDKCICGTVDTWKYPSSVNVVVMSSLPCLPSTSLLWVVVRFELASTVARSMVERW